MCKEIDVISDENLVRREIGESKTEENEELPEGDVYDESGNYIIRKKSDGYRGI